jgi:O-antigen ligase
VESAARFRLAATWPYAAGFAIAALWPVTAYAYSPVMLPAALALVGTTALIVSRPEFGLAIAVALAPFTNWEGNVQVARGVVVVKPFHILLPALVFGVLVYGLLVSRTEGQRLPWGYPGRVTIGVLVFFASGLVSSVQGLHPSASVQKTFLLLTAVALFLAVLLICRTREQLLVIVTGALASLFLAGAQGVLEQYLGHFSQAGFVVNGGVVQRVQGSFGHPNQYAGFLATLIPLALVVMVMRGFPTSMRWLAAAAVATSVPALIFSYARGAIAGVVLGTIIWLAVMRPRTAILAAVVVAVAGTVLAPSALKERLTSSEAGGDLVIREDIWSGAVQIYSQHPVFGVGLDNFSEAYAALPSNLSNAAQRRLLHQSQILVPPHAENLYLNVLAEQGIIGVAALLLLVVTALGTVFRGRRLRDPAGRGVCLGLGAGIVALGIHSLLEVTLISEVSLPLFGLLGAAAVFVALDEAEERSPARVQTAAAAAAV